MLGLRSSATPSWLKVFYYVHLLRVCVRGGGAYMEVGGQLVRGDPLLPPRGSQNGTEVVRFGSRHPYQLRHLFISPAFFNLFPTTSGFLKVLYQLPLNLFPTPSSWSCILQAPTQDSPSASSWNNLGILLWNFLEAPNQISPKSEQWFSLQWGEYWLWMTKPFLCRKNACLTFFFHDQKSSPKNNEQKSCLMPCFQHTFQISRGNPSLKEKLLLHGVIQP